MHAHPETPLSSAQYEYYQEHLKHREAGQPLPYLLGRWEFFGLDFKVDARALIPRPETELLVDEAIAISQRCFSNSSFTIADVGAGCGIIAVTLAHCLPLANVTATDISMSALSLTRKNARHHGVIQRIHCVQSDLLAGLGRFDLICANLPYIRTKELENLTVAKHEPRLALDGGHDGLRVIDRLLANACYHLRPKGKLLLEIGADHRSAALKLSHTRLPGAQCHVLSDIAGRARVLQVNSA
jgi:release factor glutamine methyltransferase